MRKMDRIFFVLFFGIFCGYFSEEVTERNEDEEKNDFWDIFFH